MENKLIVMVKKTGEIIPEIIKINNSLTDLQKIVGGNIEIVKVDDGLDMVVNESGLIDNLPYNFSLGRKDYVLDIFGDCFFTGVNYRTGEFVSLSPQQVENLMDMFIRG